MPGHDLDSGPRPRRELRHWTAALAHPAVKAPMLASLILFLGLVLTRRMSFVFILAFLLFFVGAAAWTFIAGRIALHGAPTARSPRMDGGSPHAGLVAELTRLFQVEGLEEASRQAVRQLTLLEHKVAAIKKALGQLLTPTELTYHRYLGAAEEVATAIRANATSASRHGANAAAIDRAYVTRQLERLATDVSPTAAAERTALLERLKLRDEGAAEARRIIAKNEDALTALAKLAVALEGFTPKSASTPALEAQVKDLEELAARVKLYV